MVLWKSSPGAGGSKSATASPSAKPTPTRRHPVPFSSGSLFSGSTSARNHDPSPLSHNLGASVLALSRRPQGGVSSPSLGFAPAPVLPGDVLLGTTATVVPVPPELTGGTASASSEAFPAFPPTGPPTGPSIVIPQPSPLLSPSPSLLPSPSPDLQAPSSFFPPPLLSSEEAKDATISSGGGELPLATAPPALHVASLYGEQETVNVSLLQHKLSDFRSLLLVDRPEPEPEPGAGFSRGSSFG
eukprot:RCo033713